MFMFIWLFVWLVNHHPSLHDWNVWVVSLLVCGAIDMLAYTGARW